MDFLTILLVALSLAMDAFTVSMSCAIKIGNPGVGHYFRLSFHFGLFQFMMPIIGYLLGSTVQEFTSSFAHWIAFVLLSIIGIKMIWEALPGREKACTDKDPSRGLSLIALSIATSIDALAVGITLGVLNKPVIVPSLIIGLVCSILSIVGLILGTKTVAIIGKKAEAAGGIMLIAIGIKILLENL